MGENILKACLKVVVALYITIILPLLSNHGRIEEQDVTYLLRGHRRRRRHLQ